MKIWILCILLFGVAAAVSAQERVALLIGNSDYKENSSFRNLPMVKNDVRDMERVLDSMGFYVVSLVDASKEEYNTAINRFKQASKDAKVMIVYYSGHGLMYGGDDYIVPVYEIDTDNVNEMIKLEEVYLSLKKECGEDNYKLFLYDACRKGDGIVVRYGNNRELWDKPYQSKFGYPTGVQFVFSSPASIESIGGNFHNSLFTEGLMKYLDEPIELTEMLDKVGRYVCKVSQKRYGELQQIKIEGNYAGEFYFNRTQWSEYVDSINENISYSIKENNNGRVKCVYANGDVYEGEWKNGKKNGEGVLRLSNGDLYIGEFKDGKLNGNGKKILHDNTMFEGAFSGGELNGEGKKSHPNGSKLEGTFKNGTIASGFGNFFESGYYYEGTFENGGLEGNGMVITILGDTLRGEFVNGLLDGKGTVTTPRGGSFVGNFKNGKIEGYGMMMYDDNQGSYRGEWRSGWPNGEGIFIDKYGNRFQGIFVNGSLNGYGRAVSADSTMEYIGTFKNGMFDGQGKQCLDIICAEGEFKNGTMHGTVTITNFNRVEGMVYKGEFVNNFPEGKGVVTMPNGDKYYLNMSKGNNVGDVRIEYVDGCVYEGEIWNSMPNGRGTMKCPGETEQGGEWKDGVLVE